MNYLATKNLGVSLLSARHQYVTCFSPVQNYPRISCGTSVYVRMKKILTILLIVSLLGNVVLGIRAQYLANKLGEAYTSLQSWYDFYESMPKGITIDSG